MAHLVSSWRVESWSLRSTEETCDSTVLAEILEVPAHLLVGVAAGDQAQHLALARRELVELGIEARGAGAPPWAKASSTKPARRGEKTASPAATR